MRTILNKSFFNRQTLKVARELLGKFIVKKNKKEEISAMITEVEVYDGFEDGASHAHKGKTDRNEIMFGGAGVTYIYLIYGMYYCLNIVTGHEDLPAAVLIRAVATSDKVKETNGPGKLCRYLNIDLSLNKEDIIKSKREVLKALAFK